MRSTTFYVSLRRVRRLIMSVKVTDNTNTIILNKQRGTALALRYMLDDIHKQANLTTPRDKGNLRNDVIKQVIGLKASITWSKNYAIYQEEKQFRNYTTGGTGPHFARNAVRRVTPKFMQYLRKARAL